MEVFVKSPSTLHFPTTLTLFILIISQIHHRTTATSFILKSCSTTLYPSLCASTLTPYASAVKTNPLKLCSVALAVAIQAPKNCAAAVTELENQKGVGRPEASAIKDCIRDMKDAVAELKQTVDAMGHLGGDDDREFQLSNAKTYASTAITDMETCVDGFLDEKVNQAVTKKIRSCISGVEKLISNALSLINNLKF